MGVNKVQLKTGETIMDVSGNTVNENVLYAGYTATNAQGEQITGRAVPGEGETMIQQQVDWLQKDSTQVDYIKNRPFGEEKITEHFSQIETPTPISLNSSELGMTAHKIFDTPLTSEQLRGEATITMNGYPLVSQYTESISDDIVFFIVSEDVQGVVFYNAGDLPFGNAGFTLSVPETGTYSLMPLGATLPEGIEFDLSCSVIKKIDPKFLPSTLPKVTAEDSGKFLSVDSNGQWIATDMSEWSGGSY